MSRPDLARTLYAALQRHGGAAGLIVPRDPYEALSEAERAALGEIARVIGRAERAAMREGSELAYRMARTG